MSLTQQEAEHLMAMEKRFENDDPLVLAHTRLDYTRSLVSLDGREQFCLDIWRGGLSLKKSGYQERTRTTVTLVRLDVGGGPHRNPDGELIPCPHVHLFKEGFDDKWAFPSDDILHFRDAADMVVAFEDFAHFCNITDISSIQRSMV